jgi:hypothetical protein
MSTVFRNKERRIFTILFSIALVISLFLGFIDEGYYNFNFLEDSGNIIALLIYSVFIFSCMYLVYGLFFRKVQFKGKLFVSVMLGIVLGIVMALLFFYSFKYWTA